MFAKALLLGAFAAVATAQSLVLTFTRVPNPVTDGEPQAITYATNDTSSPVTIILRKGQTGNLQTVDTLTTDANGGQFIWTPPPSLPNDNDYALEIRQAGQVNYFGPLTVQGAIPASVSAYASATSANATMTTNTASMGTGTSMSRNTTMVRPTLANSTTTNTRTTATNTMQTTSMGATTAAGSPTGASGPSSTGGASADFSAHSSFALVFGALAAVFYLG